MPIGILIPLVALSIPIIAIVLSSRRRDKDTRLEELRLQKEILELELKKQESKIKLLEAENKNLDKIIESESGSL
jgi:cell shape-determining protein MreC